MQQPLDKDRFANADEHPAKLQDSLKESRQILQVIFDQNELALWENEAMAMANHSTRSWEATVEFASSSTQVAKHLSFSSFLQWARSGSYLTKDSATLGAAYFRAGPEAVKHIQPNNLSRWAALGRSLYKGTWKSSTLSVSFFDLSPSLIFFKFLASLILGAVILTYSHPALIILIDCIIVSSVFIVSVVVIL